MGAIEQNQVLVFGIMWRFVLCKRDRNRTSGCTSRWYARSITKSLILLVHMATLSFPSLRIPKIGYHHGNRVHMLFCANLIKIGGVVAFLDSLPDHMVSESIDCMYGHSFISMTKVTKDRFSLWESCIHAFWANLIEIRGVVAVLEGLQGQIMRATID